MRILAADDDPTMGVMFRAVLGAPVFELHYVADGLAAMQAYLAEGPFDLVLLDVEMPGMSGLQVAVSIRRNQPALPIVLLTGREDADFQLALADLSAHHLAKPVDWGALAKHLQALVTVG